MTRDTLLNRRTLLRAAGGLAGAGLLPAGTVLADDGVETASGESEDRYELGDAEVLYVDVAFENADGERETATLYGEVIRPVDDGGDPVGNVPVILTYSPYNDLYQAINAGGSPARDAVAEFFVPKGYARAQFDLIGTRNSGGYYDYGGIRERESGAQLVDALGRAGWSNGNVGMIGGSYDGTTQLAAAVEAPEHLRAIVPQVAIDRWYDYKHHGGTPLNFTGGGGGTPYLFDFGFAAVPPTARDDAGHNAEATTTRAEPGDRVAHTLRSTEYRSPYDAFWTERDYRRRATDVPADVGVLIEGGWEDRNVKRWGSTRFFEALPEEVDARLVMGDWGHATSQFRDAWAVRHAWFDSYLLELDVDLSGLPPVDTRSATSPRTQFDDWPPADSETAALPLVRADAGQGELELLGTGFPTFRDGSPPVSEDEMFAQRGSGERHLMFETPELADDLRITGHVRADLLAVSTADTWFTAVVYDRAPDGSHQFVARGFLDSRYRASPLEPQGDGQDTPVGRAYRAPVHCWDIDWTVREGHRLGLVVASDNEEWARHDPRNQGENLVELGESTLQLDATDTDLDLRTLPAADLARDSGARAYTGGQTARITVTVEDAEAPVGVRDRVPEGWTVLGGDVADTYEVRGTTYVELAGDLDAGETRAYYAEAPDDPGGTGTYTFGPLEYAPHGEVWTTATGTTKDNAVVGVGTDT